MPPDVQAMTPTFDVSLLNFLCCWFDRLKLSARQSMRPIMICQLLSVASHDFSSLGLVVLQVVRGLTKCYIN